MSFSDSGTSPRGDALRDALDDRGLADARLADQHRVVLGPARQHLHRRAGPPRRARSPDRACPVRASSVRSRVYFASAWYFALGLGIGHALRCRAPRPAPSAARPCVRPRPSGRGWPAPKSLADQRQQQVLAGDVFVLELLRLPGRLVEQVLEPPPDVDVGASAPRTCGCASSASSTAWRTRLGVDAQLAQHGAARCRPAGRAAPPARAPGVSSWWSRLAGEIVRRLQRLLSLDGELVESHRVPSQG